MSTPFVPRAARPPARRPVSPMLLLCAFALSLLVLLAAVGPSPDDAQPAISFDLPMP